MRPEPIRVLNKPHRLRAYLEVPTGFEPVNGGFADLCLTSLATAPSDPGSLALRTFTRFPGRAQPGLRYNTRHMHPTAERRRRTRRARVAIFVLVTVLVGALVHQHVVGDPTRGSGPDQCAACAIGQSPPAPAVTPVPAAPPAVDGVAPLLPAGLAAAGIPPLSLAPKTSPPSRNG
jgi:hypothetical protein